MRIQKLTILFIASVMVTLGVSISLQSLLAAWTSPTQTAPNGNASAPLNVSSAIQVKDGGLSLNHLGTSSSNGLIIENGNVGIGTTGPGYKLDVSGVIASTGGQLRLTGYSGNADDSVIWFDNTSNNYIYNNSGTFTWRAGGGDRLTIQSGGNVGIGVSSPTQKLDVAGGIHASGDICTDQGGGNCLSTIADGSLPPKFVFAHATTNRYDHCPTGYVQLFSLYTSTTDNENDTGAIYTYINGGATVVAGATYLEVCRKLNSDELYGGIHTEAQCTAAGGTVSGSYCVFTGYCASGWTYVANWSTTYPRYCPGAAAVNPTGGICPGTDCTTGSHDWSNTPVEACDYGDAFYNGETSSCEVGHTTCWAGFLNTLCY